MYITKLIFHRNKDKILDNKSTGLLLRSKPKRFDEGGVAAGFGALDYPYLEWDFILVLNYSILYSSLKIANIFYNPAFVFNFNKINLKFFVICLI